MVENTTSKVVKRLTGGGWTLVRHGANHDVYSHTDRPFPIQVPRHRNLSPGVARSIAKAAGWI
ncbi:MAG: type II toxin-antitoxin system HicA family toxin [Pseudomonadota bacterium]|nr:type II toxin-antitoxin system HicA family toxin [Pseudomonadota bacterium]